MSNVKPILEEDVKLPADMQFMSSYQIKLLAIRCAELAEPFWKKMYPQNDLAQKMIQAAKVATENPTKENQQIALGISESPIPEGRPTFALESAINAADAASYSDDSSEYTFDSADLSIYCALKAAEEESPEALKEVNRRIGQYVISLLNS